MAEPAHESMPGPPSGMQRPGIPGAGNVLDPEVRAEVREQLHPAVHEAAQRARGDQAAPPVEASSAATVPTPTSPVKHRAGPFAHGDVDLSGLPANVPVGPVRPQRSRSGRRYYFLPATGEVRDEPPPAPRVEPPARPKPG